jgi:hypothetical protein
VGDRVNIDVAAKLACSFVYVQGREGFVWFVKNGDVVAVSGGAKNMTPDALDPYEVHVEFWKATGADADSVFRAASDIAYRHWRMIRWRVGQRCRF